MLLTAYLALPLWLPSLVRLQLAQGWELESLEFDYPYNFDLHLDNIVLSGNPGGTGVRIAARDLAIDIRQLSIDASSMEVDIALADSASKVDLPALDDLAVPIIFQPGKLPRVSIDSLRLNLQSDGMGDKSWLFTELQIVRNETESWFKTSLPLPEVSSLSGEIEIRIRHDALQASLHLQSPDQRKVLEIVFRQSGQDKNISSEVSGKGHLQDLQPLLALFFPEMEALNIQGQVSFEGQFGGSEKQILEHAKLTAQNVSVDLGSESLGLDVQLEALRQEDWVLINFPAAGTFRVSDDNSRISSLLDGLLWVTRFEADSAEEVNDSLLIAIEAHSEIRLRGGDQPAAEFTGAVAAEFSSSLLDLSLEAAPDTQFQLAEGFNPASLSGSGTVKVELESRQALTFISAASITIPPGTNLRAAGWLELDEHTVRFTDSTEFRASIPSLTANIESTNLEFRGLEISGTTDLLLPLTRNENAVEFHYSGNAKSASAWISQSGPGQARQTLVDLEHMDLQLDISQSGEQMRSSGSGTAHQVRIDSSGLFARQMDFEWRQVDPLTLTGKFRTHTQGMVFSREGETYPGVDLDVAYTLLANDRVEGRGDLLFTGEVRTPIRFSGNLDSGDWTIDILPTQLSLRQAVKALETSIGEMPDQIELAGGEIKLEGRVSMGNTVEGTMDISGTALSFSLAESTIEGASFKLSGKLNETLAGTGWLSIDRIALAAGLDLLQTRVSVGLMTPDTIKLDDLQAEFFGGRLSADHIWLAPQGLLDTQIKMNDIDLGQVLEYIDVGGLTGTGKLEISLPVGSQGASLYINKGVFRANGPGILSYSESLAATAAENIGLAALENFHYTELDGTIDYHLDGSYRLTVHLAGSNPDLYNGYPISLNLNIGGMLPEAFEVLFLSGDFDQAILNRFKQEILE